VNSSGIDDRQRDTALSNQFFVTVCRLERRSLQCILIIFGVFSLACWENGMNKRIVRPVMK
jgi:hypothetical protein